MNISQNSTFNKMLTNNDYKDFNKKIDKLSICFYKLRVGFIDEYSFLIDIKEKNKTTLIRSEINNMIVENISNVIEIVKFNLKSNGKDFYFNKFITDLKKETLKIDFASDQNMKKRDDVIKRIEKLFPLDNPLNSFYCSEKLDPSSKINNKTLSAPWKKLEKELLGVTIKEKPVPNKKAVWTEEENELFKHLVESYKVNNKRVSVIDIAKNFPDKSWGQCRSHLNTIRKEYASRFKEAKEISADVENKPLNSISNKRKFTQIQTNAPLNKKRKIVPNEIN